MLPGFARSRKERSPDRFDHGESCLIASTVRCQAWEKCYCGGAPWSRTLSLRTDRQGACVSCWSWTSIRLVLIPGVTFDSPVGVKLLEGVCANHVLADAAYGSASIRQCAKWMWAKAHVKPKSQTEVEPESEEALRRGSLPSPQHH